mmetsp:Transcript_55543/g.174272  ORF Transcript_55543/g.174272 Transcript_55543/m.174272 type:complete len:257 (-) Transcript_55543:233-1003(-)
MGIRAGADGRAACLRAEGRSAQWEGPASGARLWPPGARFRGCLRGGRGLPREVAALAGLRPKGSALPPLCHGRPRRRRGGRAGAGCSGEERRHLLPAGLCGCRREAAWRGAPLRHHRDLRCAHLPLQGGAASGRHAAYRPRRQCRRPWLGQGVRGPQRHGSRGSSAEAQEAGTFARRLGALAAAPAARPQRADSRLAAPQEGRLRRSVRSGEPSPKRPPHPLHRHAPGPGGARRGPGAPEGSHPGLRSRPSTCGGG